MRQQPARLTPCHPLFDIGGDKPAPYMQVDEEKSFLEVTLGCTRIGQKLSDASPGSSSAAAVGSIR